MLRLTLAAFALFLAAGASAQPAAGRLDAADDTLNSGEFRDEYTVAVRAGDEVSAVVTSEAFDTYVLLVSPTGAQVEDDDCTDGETTRSCVTFTADAEGALRVLVTSFAVGETGAYVVTVTVGGAVVALVPEAETREDVEGGR